MQQLIVQSAIHNRFSPPERETQHRFTLDCRHLVEPPSFVQ